MPKPISRRDLIRRLRIFGWSGPYGGGRHQAMEKDRRSLPIPNPHGKDIDWTLTKRILKQANIDPQQWEENK